MSIHYFHSRLGSKCHAGNSSKSLHSFLIIPSQDHLWSWLASPLPQAISAAAGQQGPGDPFFPSSFAYETCNLSCWQSMAPCGHCASLGTIIQRLSLIVPRQHVIHGQNEKRSSFDVAVGEGGQSQWHYVIWQGQLLTEPFVVLHVGFDGGYASWAWQVLLYDRWWR